MSVYDRATRFDIEWHRDSVTLDANGEYAFTFDNTYAATPIVLATITLATNLETTLWINAHSTTGWTVKVFRNGVAYASSAVTINWMARPA